MTLVEELENKLIKNYQRTSNDCPKRWFFNGYKLAFEEAISIVQHHSGWIPVSERLPEEHDSIFATSKCNGHWCEGMFMKVSDKVNVTIEFEDGKRKSDTSYTQDGAWLIEKQHKAKKCKVISWQPLPKPDEK